jgi:hypothetical protein
MILLLASLGAPPALAQDQNPVRRGLAVAERRCAGCHAVHAGESASPNTAAASFARVAATPGMTELALQAMLQSAGPARTESLGHSARSEESREGAWIPRCARNDSSGA